MRSWTVALITLVASTAFGHAHLVSPAPRDPNPGIKVGPCGPMAKSQNPITLTGGTTLTVQWQETINHPGKYIFTWLQTNDTPMVGVPVIMIPDNQDVGAVPHNYTTTLTVPNVACANCGLQLVQSMEENPAVPTYYYSCVDIKIVTAGGGTPTPTPTATPGPTATPTPTGSPGVVVIQSALANGEKTHIGSSCGSVALVQRKGGSGGGFGGGASGGLMLAMFPLLTFLLLRRRLAYARR